MSGHARGLHDDDTEEDESEDGLAMQDTSEQASSSIRALCARLYRCGIASPLSPAVDTEDREKSQEKSQKCQQHLAANNGLVATMFEVTASQSNTNRSSKRKVGSEKPDRPFAHLIEVHRT